MYLSRLAGVIRRESRNQFLHESVDTQITSAGGTLLGEELERVTRASLMASSNYVPRPYSGRVLVYRATERAEMYPDLFLGWRTVARGSISAVNIEANHSTIFESPWVSAMARNMKYGTAGAHGPKRDARETSVEGVSVFRG